MAESSSGAAAELAPVNPIKSVIFAMTRIHRVDGEMALTQGSLGKRIPIAGMDCNLARVGGSGE
jgi:hypothetical protein